MSSQNNINTLMDYPYETDSNYNTQNPLFRNESIRNNQENENHNRLTN